MYHSLEKNNANSCGMNIQYLRQKNQ